MGTQRGDGIEESRTEDPKLERLGQRVGGGIRSTWQWAKSVVPTWKDVDRFWKFVDGNSGEIIEILKIVMYVLWICGFAIGLTLPPLPPV